MITRYTLEAGQLKEAPQGPHCVTVAVNPDETERKELLAEFVVDEHNLHSSLDPEEPARLEVEDGHMELIFKRPKNYSSKDHFLFKVSSMGLFLFKDRLLVVLSEEMPIFTGKYFKHVAGLREIFLKLIYNAIFHFMEHLKVINMIADEIETKITKSMENRYLLNMFTLEKSLVYYLNAISSNAFVIERLKANAEKLNFTERSREFIDDVLIENTQCYRQAEIYSNIFASLVGARASIVSNNLNILLKNLNAIVIAIAVPSFFAGMGGMSELTGLFGAENWYISYPAFLTLMILMGVAIFHLIKRFEKH